MTKHAVLALALLCEVYASPLALQNNAAPGERSDIDQVALRKKIENYLNGLFMLEGTFVQVIVRKGQSTSPITGKFYMQRPNPDRSNDAKTNDSDNKSHGQLNGVFISINLPNQKILVRNGIVQMTDVARHKTSNYRASSVPFIKLFSENRVELMRMLKSVHCDSSSNQAYVTLDMGRNSEVVLLFTLYPNKNVKTFSGWSIKDSHGTITSIAFLEGSIVANSNAPIPPELLSFRE
ncbi:MAG: hypothetical protein LBJ89_00410 [Holosporales bacterium]|jgi:hypothetical protein|nr:hypothetical protein [Holosporales bacterium]